MQTQNPVIDSFRGRYHFLSNFYVVPGGFFYNGVKYPTAEHAYQAAKAPTLPEREKIRKLATAAEAKRAGNRLPKLVPHWLDRRLDVMFAVVYSKFDSSDQMRQLLLDTWGFDLIEGNTWGDTFWGICDGVGANHLGETLMTVRHDLKYRNPMEDK